MALERNLRVSVNLCVFPGSRRLERRRPAAPGSVRRRHRLREAGELRDQPPSRPGGGGHREERVR